MTVLLTNNAKTVLAIGISTSDTLIRVRAGTGVLFPMPTASDEWFPVALTDINGNTEYLRCEQRIDDVLYVKRGQEGTQPRVFQAGDIADLRLTVAAINDLPCCGDAPPTPTPPTMTIADITVVANRDNRPPPSS